MRQRSTEPDIIIMYVAAMTMITATKKRTRAVTGLFIVAAI